MDAGTETTTGTGDGAAPGAVQQVTTPAQLPAGECLESFLERIERQLITEALEATRWNKTAAARRLGITFRALRYRLKKLELD
jgi:two-component system response regulator PilR (NtrC family)